MRRLLTGLLLAAALAGAASAAQPTRVLAVEWEAGGGKLRWVSATTLKPVGSAVLNIGGAPVDIAAVSPDGTFAAIGGGAEGRLRLVRLNGLRQIRLFWLGEGSVFGGIWPTRERLVVLLGGADAAVVVLDPSARRVVRRQRLDGIPMGAVRAGRFLLTLLAPDQGLGAARLAVIAGDGSVRTVALPGITAGFAPARSEQEAGRQASPALAADPAGNRAAVVGRDTLLVVDLDTLEVRQSLEARAPASVAKRIEGWGRRAVWVRGDTIAVGGWNDSYDATMGVDLLDLGTGARRRLDATATVAQLIGSTLIAYGGSALRGYRLDGSLRFELLAGQDSGYVQTAGSHLYVGSGNSTRFVVVDSRAGRILKTVRMLHPTIVLAPR